MSETKEEREKGEENQENRAKSQKEIHSKLKIKSKKSNLTEESHAVGSSMTLLTYSLNSSSWNTANASNSIESYAVEITEEYLRRVELPYNNNQVNPQTVTQRKVILFGKLGVEKASMIKLTHNDTNQQNSK